MPRVETSEKRASRLAQNKIRSQKWYAENRERHLITSRTNYLRTKTRKVKLAKIWAANHPDQIKATRRRYEIRHVEKLRALNREWVRNNRKRYNQRRRRHYAAMPQVQKEKYRAQRQAFYRNNRALFYFHVSKRKALKRKLECNPKQIKEWWCATLEKSFVNCYYCQSLIHASDAHMEHVISLKRSGPHSITNLCTACPSCNLSKGSKLPSEWTKLPQRFLDL